MPAAGSGNLVGGRCLVVGEDVFFECLPLSGLRRLKTAKVMRVVIFIVMFVFVGLTPNHFCFFFFFFFLTPQIIFVVVVTCYYCYYVLQKDVEYVQVF